MDSICSPSASRTAPCGSAGPGHLPRPPRRLRHAVCQALGTKEVLLAPAEEIELADHGAGYHGPDIDLDDPAGLASVGLDAVALRRAVIGPGQALLVPAGWWHQVRARTPSVSLTFVGMRHRNDYRWYRPAPPDPLGSE
ncbi:MAG: cupin-like domain-containing protein [Myxococcota bacterium]